MKLGEHKQFDALKKIAYRATSKNAPNAIFRLVLEPNPPKWKTIVNNKQSDK